MANITRGSHDPLLAKLQSVLEEYENQNVGSAATLYRQNSASIRIRIIDERFSKLSKGDRHDQVWKFLSDRLTDDDVQEISVLLLLAPDEQGSSIMNAEFDAPLPSTL